MKEQKIKPQDAIIGSNQDFVYNVDNVFILSIILVLIGCIKILFILTMELFWCPLTFYVISSPGLQGGNRSKDIKQVHNKARVFDI